MSRSVWVLALLAGALSAQDAPPLRVLFLGNSYTYYNHLAGLVEGMARAAGQPMEARFVALGGATLERVYRETNALEVLRGGRWDYVVLQEQSTLGLNLLNGDWTVNDPAGFHVWARLWAAEVRANGARPVFLNTWAREGRTEMQRYLDWAYASVARELSAPLIPAGDAFQNAIARSPEIKLYSDGSHPTAEGSYLAACTAVVVLTGRGCVTAPDAIAGVPMDNASARLRNGEPGPIVRLAPGVAKQLRDHAMAALTRLQSEGGYWTLARPAYPMAESPAPATAKGSPAGTWHGATWLYGKPAEVTLEMRVEGSACSGTWTIRALDPPTQTSLPLQRCTVSAGGVAFEVTTLFGTAEVHQARLSPDAVLRGTVGVRTQTAYHRQTGTWELRRSVR